MLHADDDDDLSRVPTEKEILSLSKGIVGEWKFISRQLGFCKGHIAEIAENAKGDVREQAHQMLMKWKERNGNEASVKELCKALEKEDLKETAQTVFGYLSSLNDESSISI